MDSHTHPTELLAALAAGDEEALDLLVPHVYDEIRRIAHRERARRTGGETLRTTALVNEAYLKIAGGSARVEDRAHFMALAATVVRHLLIDEARRKQSLKRGGGWREISVAVVETDGPDPLDVLALDAAMTRLAEHDERLARVVECRYFGGMTVEETAAALGLSPRSVDRAWRKAKAWLYQEIK